MTITKDLCLMAVAQNISDEIKTRFKQCAELSNPNCSFDVVFLDEPMGKGYVFSKSRIMNNGIKSLYNRGYKVIVQVDVDLIIPPGLLDKALEIGSTPMTCFHNHHRRYNPKNYPWIPVFPHKYEKMDWNRAFEEIVPENANGAFNAMTPESWIKSWGFNELMVGWALEDDVFRTTAYKQGIRFINDNSFCLLHVNHRQRTENMRYFNRKMEKQIAAEGGRNWFKDVQITQ